jgi:hypothetical protein
MTADSTCFFSGGESRSDLFQRTRKLRLWNEVEQFISERRKVHRAAGMNRREAGNAAWADAEDEFPPPNQTNLRRILELSDYPILIETGETRYLYLWQWIASVELLVRISSLISLPDIETALIAAIERRMTFAVPEPQDWADRVVGFRKRTVQLLAEGPHDAVAEMIGRFAVLNRELGHSERDEAVRGELRILDCFFGRLAELQVESVDSLASAMKSVPTETSLHRPYVRVRA